MWFVALLIMCVCAYIFSCRKTPASSWFLSPVNIGTFTQLHYSVCATALLAINISVSYMDPVQHLILPNQSTQPTPGARSTSFPGETLCLNSYIITASLYWFKKCKSSTHSKIIRGGLPYLITNQHMDASRALFKDLIDLPGWDAEQMSNFLCQFCNREFLQVNGVIYCRERNRKVNTS